MPAQVIPLILRNGRVARLSPDDTIDPTRLGTGVPSPDMHLSGNGEWVRSHVVSNPIISVPVGATGQVYAHALEGPRTSSKWLFELTCGNKCRSFEAISQYSVGRDVKSSRYAVAGDSLAFGLVFEGDATSFRVLLTNNDSAVIVVSLVRIRL